MLCFLPPLLKKENKNPQTKIIEVCKFKLKGKLVN